MFDDVPKIQRTCGLPSLLGLRKLPFFALRSVNICVFHGILEKLHWKDFLGLGPVCTNQALDLRLSNKLLFQFVISKLYPVILYPGKAVS